MVSGQSLLRGGALLVLFLVCLQTPTQAETRVLGITYLPMTSCNEVWDWNGCASKMVPTTFGDPGGSGHCYWTQPSGRIKMYPARIEIDVAPLKGIERVEVDVNELERISGTKIYALGGGQAMPFNSAYSTKMGTQTVQLDVTAMRATTIYVACQDCEVSQVRLVAAGTIIPVDYESFSTVKSFFR